MERSDVAYISLNGVTNTLHCSYCSSENNVIGSHNPHDDSATEKDRDKEGKFQEHSTDVKYTWKTHEKIAQ